MQYTPEQIEDIRTREEKALATLKELNFTPACIPQLVNLGNDTFGIQLHPYLNDTKFTPSPSPIQ